MENILAYERKDYIRMGVKDQMTIKRGANYTKRVKEDYKRIIKLYNSKGDFIGLDVKKSEEEIETVISIKNKGLSIVIIERDGMKFKGTAKCHEDDSFIVQNGYEIAKARAEIKYNENKLAKYK